MADNTTQYSFLHGLQKAVVTASVFGLSLVAVFVASAYPDLNSQPVADVLVNAISSKLHMIFGTMTVGGLVALVINYLKVKFPS